jgi:hypothetical protein
MSSLPYNVSDSLSLPAGFQDKKAILLSLSTRYERWAEVRPASRLEVRPRPEMLSSGVPAVDAIAGGIPRGCLTELCGANSSGKTSVLLAAMAAATRREETCALIDASDSFDPRSGHAAGMDFDRLLWVRCGGLRRRTTARRAVADSQEPEADDRRPKSDDFEEVRTRSERRLEQVLKTTDLVLQSGGFGLITLDLAGIPKKFVRRIPLASWFRFQRAAERTKTALLVVSDLACAQSCAALVLQFGRRQASALRGRPSERPAHAELLAEMCAEVELVRSRLERKPMQSVKRSFTTQAVRAG